MADISTELTVPQQIKIELSKRRMKQRDLFMALVRAGVDTSETKLSNRLNEVGPSFTQEEINEINKVLGTKYKIA